MSNSYYPSIFGTLLPKKMIAPLNFNTISLPLFVFSFNLANQYTTYKKNFMNIYENKHRQQKTKTTPPTTKIINKDEPRK